MGYTDFDKRMKSYELDIRFMPLLPVIIRVDGKNFSRFTKGLEKPYCQQLAKVFLEVTKALVEQTNATVGYTQSDEISLILYSDQHSKQIFFDGRKDKIVSVISSLTTTLFNKFRAIYLPEFKPYTLSLFDCRANTYPNTTEAYNYLLWRELDATKNALYNAASQYASHKELQNKKVAYKHEVLYKHGINFNDYPTYFKRGSYFKRVRVEKPKEKLLFIPEQYMPEGPVYRNEVQLLDLPPISQLNQEERTNLITSKVF